MRRATRTWLCLLTRRRACTATGGWRGPWRPPGRRRVVDTPAGGGQADTPAGAITIAPMGVHWPPWRVLHSTHSTQVTQQATHHSTSVQRIAAVPCYILFMRILWHCTRMKKGWCNNIKHRPSAQGHAKKSWHCGLIQTPHLRRPERAPPNNCGVWLHVHVHSGVRGNAKQPCGHAFLSPPRRGSCAVLCNAQHELEGDRQEAAVHVQLGGGLVDWALP